MMGNTTFVSNKLGKISPVITGVEKTEAIIISGRRRSHDAFMLEGVRTEPARTVKYLEAIIDDWRSLGGYSLWFCTAAPFYIKL